MSIVQTVQCVAAEGSLTVMIWRTFRRLMCIFGLDYAPTANQLRRLRPGAVDFGGIEAAACGPAERDAWNAAACGRAVDGDVERARR